MNRRLFWTIAAVICLMAGTVGQAFAQCETHAFGAADNEQHIYADGLTWDFTAETGMWVRTIELKSYLAYIDYPRKCYIDLGVNGVTVATFTQTPIIPADRDAAIAAYSRLDADIFLHVGDSVTVKISGGTPTTPAAIITGENTLRLCGEITRKISVSSASLADRVVETREAPGPAPMGLAFDGTDLWVSDFETNRIYRLDADGEVAAEIPSPGFGPVDLAFDGTNLWCADFENGRAYGLDVDGNILGFANTPGTSPVGLAFDGEEFWNSDFDSATLYQINPAGTVSASFPAPGFGPLGLAFDGTHLWNADASGRIFQLTLDGDLVDTYTAPGELPGGITFDGTHLWITDLGEGAIYQVKPPEPLTATADTTAYRTFTVTNDSFYTGLDDEDLVIGAVALSGPAATSFKIADDGASGQTLAPNESAEIRIAFSPRTAGEKRALLTIPSNDPNRPLLEIPLTGIGTECLVVAGDLAIPLPCVTYDDIHYAFTLGFYPNPDDPEGAYWKLDPDTLKVLETPTDQCLSVGESLDLDFVCVHYDGADYSLTLEPAPMADDPENLYWKLDPESFTEAD